MHSQSMTIFYNALIKLCISGVRLTTDKKSSLNIILIEYIQYLIRRRAWSIIKSDVYPSYAVPFLLLFRSLFRYLLRILWLSFCRFSADLGLLSCNIFILRLIGFNSILRFFTKALRVPFDRIVNLPVCQGLLAIMLLVPGKLRLCFIQHPCCVSISNCEKDTYSGRNEA